MEYSKLLKSKLNDIIVDVSMNPDFITTFNSILSMGGNSLDHEMLELFNFSDYTPTKSALFSFSFRFQTEIEPIISSVSASVIAQIIYLLCSMHSFIFSMYTLASSNSLNSFISSNG